MCCCTLCMTRLFFPVSIVSLFVLHIYCKLSVYLEDSCHVFNGVSWHTLFKKTPQPLTFYDRYMQEIPSLFPHLSSTTFPSFYLTTCHTHTLLSVYPSCLLHIIYTDCINRVGIYIPGFLFERYMHDRRTLLAVHCDSFFFHRVLSVCMFRICTANSAYTWKMGGTRMCICASLFRRVLYCSNPS